jgi:AAA15 family ATPase/GTPase
MLIRFTVENFMSFRSPVELSMIPGKGTSLSHHVRRGTRRSDLPHLKSAIVYGANASGKSNLVKAMHFAQWLVRQGLSKGQVIPVKPFRLDARTQAAPSRFEFEFQWEDTYYAYGFSVGTQRIYEEWLAEISKTSEKVLFERKTTDAGVVEVDLLGFKFPTKDNQKRVGFMADDTLPNELFLSSVNRRNLSELPGVEPLQHAYAWLTEHLKIIFPESRLSGLEVELESDQAFLNAFNRLLTYFHTGISGIEIQAVDLESPEIDLPQGVKTAIKERLSPGERVIFSAMDGVRYTLRRDEAGELFAVKVMTRHRVAGKEKEALFEVHEESDGTQRIMDLISMLADLQTESSVYVIDELDRSLHPSLTYRLLELFHSEDSPTRGQLIVTTHESGLLDLNLLRKDEIWFVEKDADGASRVYSLEEFKPRKDKEVRRGYLQGRYGAVPVFRPKQSLQAVLEMENLGVYET